MKSRDADEYDPDRFSGWIIKCRDAMELMLESIVQSKRIPGKS